MTTFVRAGVDAGAMTLPAAYYTDPAVFAAEQERIFAREWLLVGRSEQIASQGDYFLVQIGHDSLIVVRDKAGQPHAHFNVCRHRGTRLCTDAQGQLGSSIQCPYHAWTYGLDGQLLAARTMSDVPGFDRADYPLHQAQIAEWEGFLFVNLDPQAAPFAISHAPLIGKFSAWGMPDLRVAKTIDYDLECNWKLVFQNYSECYHCPLIHPALDRLSPSTSGRNDLSEGPFLGGYMTLNHDVGSMTISGKAAARPVGNLPAEDLDRVYYYTLFPNVLLSLHADYVMVHTITPQSAGRTHVRCQWLFAPGADPAGVDDAVAFWDMTNRQDWEVSVLTQHGAMSRAYTPGPYAHSEGLLWAFDQHYRSVLESE